MENASSKECYESLYVALKQAVAALKFKSHFDELYGQGLEISNWHQNGDLEPFDNFYESASSGEIESTADENQQIDDWIVGRNPTKEECGDYGETEFQVTVDENGLKTISMSFVYEKVWGKEIGRWKWCDRPSPLEVIAWKPLSKPYILKKD